MSVVVGLGNPGPKYRNTRHNVGFRVLDLMADRLKAPFARERYRGLVAETRLGDRRLLLLKPQTFMNVSGASVAEAARYWADSPEDVLVVADDVNLPLGRLRFRAGGSAGGHNGLKSIIAQLGSQDFPRLRIGVGDDRGGADLADHVLGTFSPDERQVVEETIERAVSAVLCYLDDGLETAMNRYNGS